MKKYIMFTIFLISYISISFSQTPVYFKPAATNTGYNKSHIIALPFTSTLSCNPNINGTALATGDEIGVFNSSNVCCGSVYWKKETTTLVAWGDNENTTKIDGFSVGEIMRFRIYQKSSKKAYYATVEYDNSGINKGTYALNGISALKSIRGTTVVSVEDEKNDKSMKFSLAQNYPNPFNPTTMISFTVPTQSKVSVIIYDLNGREISRPVSGETKSSGIHSFEWNGRDSKGNRVSSGLYFYKLEALSLEQNAKDVFTQVRTMLLTK